MGGHDFLDYMSFRMICIMITFVLRELCFVVGNLLWDIKYWWNACLKDGILYNLLCFPETCLTGGHVLLEDIVG